ncbi:MAG: hypothetical protein H6Q68_2315 [Firmicutes bacterium]|nr:hypothetical protein [Bacillota bacterium]
MEVRINETASDYIRDKLPDNSITLEVVERPGGV